MLQAFEEVMAVRGRGTPEPGEVTITGTDPVLATRFRIGETCAAVLGGVGVALSDLWEMKTGRRQKVFVDVRRAAAALRSSSYLQRQRPDGTFAYVPDENQEAMRRITQAWPTKDGRWFLPHFGLSNLKARVLKVLGCEPTPDSVAKAVGRWDALDLEVAIDEARACGAMVRTNTQWLAHAHGQALAVKPIVEIIKLGNSAPEPLPDGPRPLSGVRVLDLTRILAGPICARTLAEHGADVLMVTAAHLPQVPEHVTDTSHGKRSTFLDLARAEDAAQLKALVKDTHVFSQGYRPGALARLGFTPEQLTALRPGLIYVSTSCFGADGPLSHRAGWEQVAQTVTGILQEGSPDRPALLPGAACDYTTGYLAAYGTLLALARRAREGGSWHVRVSLCQSGMLIYRQGKVEAAGMGLPDAEVDAMRIESWPKSGALRHLAPVMQLSETPPRWERPTPHLGGDTAAWL